MLDTIRYRVHGTNQQKKGIMYKTMTEKNPALSLMIVPSHNDLYNVLNAVKKKGFSTTKILSNEKIVFSDKPFEEVLSSRMGKHINEHYIAMNKIRFSSGDVVKERNLAVKGRYKLDSSETGVTFIINYEGGFIDFEFSIPKYLYGHNLAEFVPQYRSSLKSTHGDKLVKWNVQRDLTHQRLERFTTSFFNDLFLNLKLEEAPNFDYIEILRFDLCYNQYFDSKEDSLQYLKHQKKFQKKSKIYSPDTNTDFETTLAYRTQNGNYFKIYHKGTEYINQKHGDFHKHTEINNRFIENLLAIRETPLPTLHEAFDEVKLAPRKQLTKKNVKTIKTIIKSDVLEVPFHLTPEEYSYYKPYLDKVHNKLPIDTHFLKTEMDKVLRYEMSITGKAKSYYFKNNVFRKNCNIHKNAKRIYKKVKRDLESIERNNGVKIIKRTIPQYAMDIYTHFQNWSNRTCALVLSRKKIIVNNSINGARDYDKKNDKYFIGQIYSELNYGTLLETRDVYSFSDSYLRFCIDHFKQTIDRLQVHKIEPFDDLRLRVMRFNSEVKTNRENYPIKDLRQLKESEKIRDGLKTINYSNIVQLYNMLYEKGMSVNQIRKELLLSDNQYYRRLSDLKMLGISESHVQMEKEINVRTDFLHYYFNTSKQKYCENFYMHDALQYEN